MFLHCLNVPVLLFALTPFASLLVSIKQVILIILYISIFDRAAKYTFLHKYSDVYICRSKGYK